ncbi:MAG: hypothetical protein MJ252_19115 [archaeon]|nr:hypothetical protein [archaeon]
MRLGILLIISLVTFINPQLLVSSYGYEYVLSTSLQKFQNLLDKNLPELLKAQKIEDFKYKDYSISGVNLKSTSINVLGSYVNLKTGKMIFSPNKIGMTYGFKCTIGEESFEDAEIEMTIFDTQVQLKYNTETKETTKIVKVTTREKDIHVYGIDKYKEDIKEGMIAKFRELTIKDKIIQQLQDNLLNYFEEIYHKQIPDYKLKLSSLLENKEVTVDMKAYYGQCEEAHNFDSALCFFPGTSQQLENITAYRNQYSEYENFTKWDESFKAFVNLELIKQFFNAAKGAIMSLSPNSNVAKELKLDLTVKAAKDIFDPITGDDATPLTIKSTLKDITFDKYKGTISLESKINDGTSDLVTFTSTLDYEAALKNTATTFDFCFSKITLKEKKIEGETVKFKDEAKFDELYNSILNYSIDKVCLTDNGITVRDYFRYLEKSEPTENGFVLTGQKLYGY